MERKIVKLQGLNIDTFDFESALNYAKNNSGQVITINPEMVVRTKKNSGFKKIINEAELVIPDGIGVEIGLKILGHNVKRIAGIEFSRKLLEESKGKSVALVGAKPHVAEKAAANLKSEMPDLNIVYIKDGYFNDTRDVYNDLKEIQPAIVLAALGSPRQEDFLFGLKQRLPNTLMIGVGGSFDVWAGEVERAPEIYQKMGLEWLYRTIKEPKRFKRIFPTLPLFVFRVIKEKIQGV